MSFNRYDICISDTSKLDSFKHDINTIKGYLCEVGNTYLLVSFRVWEMQQYQSFSKYYKNIVEACQSELGFKKSTTYNMINIVERFAQRDEYGQITYNTFVNNKYSYSQLCEMLSLSDKQLEQIKPETTVKEIREIKKTFQTSGKVPEPEQQQQSYIDVDYVIAENGIEEAPAVPIAPQEEQPMQYETYEESDTHICDDTYVDIELYLNQVLALKRFINFCNSKDFSDYDVIKNIANKLDEALEGGVESESKNKKNKVERFKRKVDEPSIYGKKANFHGLKNIS